MPALLAPATLLEDKNDEIKNFDANHTLQLLNFNLKNLETQK